MSKQGMGFELFQTLMFEESIETQPGTIQISPIANIREFSEESANPVLMEAAGYLQTRLRSLGREDLSERLENDPQTSLILCAQGSAPYLYANELWGIILAAAGEMPEAIFLMAGAEAELEDRRRQPHPRNMVFLGWEPGFRDILGSFHVYPRSLLITRPGLSMLGLALCSGIGPVLGPPDRLVDLQTTDESLAAVVGEVQDERTVAVVQYLLFLRRGGLRDEELCRQIIPIKGANPAATVDALREAIALQPKVRRLIRTGIYPSVRADLIPILTGLLDGEPMAFEEIKARLYAACWRHRETFG